MLCTSICYVIVYSYMLYTYTTSIMLYAYTTSISISLSRSSISLSVPVCLSIYPVYVIYVCVCSIIHSHVRLPSLPPSLPPSLRPSLSHAPTLLLCIYISLSSPALTLPLCQGVGLPCVCVHACVRVCACVWWWC